MNNQKSQSQGLLLFNLTAHQTFAIGTLKIQEIVPYCTLTVLPQSHPAVLGAATIRGSTISVIDMAAAIGYPPVPQEEYQQCVIIITDCSRQLTGFLVRGIERIIECDWKQIEAPPATLGKNVYVTGVTRQEDKLIQLMDVELLLDQIYPGQHDENIPVLTGQQLSMLQAQNILLVDDSAVARRQLAGALDALGIPYKLSRNGKDAFNIMKQEAAAAHPINILVSDIEMPGLDGYELTFEVRSNAETADVYIILHTSLSSEISVDRAGQVGADVALTKFDAKELIEAMLEGASRGHQEQPQISY